METKFKKLIFCTITFVFSLVCHAQTSVTHVVQRGESMESIASKYGVTADAIRQANEKSNGLFYVGMKLNIPERVSKVENRTNDQYSPTSTNSSVADNSGTIAHGSSDNHATMNTQEYELGEESMKGKFEGFLEILWGDVFPNDYLSDAMSSFNLSCVGTLGASYYVTNEFSVCAGVGYKTFSYSPKSEYSQFIPSQHYHFITLPVHLRYNIVKNFGIYLGPRFDFPVSAKMSLNNKSEKIKGLDSAYASLDLGIKLFKWVKISYNLPLNGKKDRLYNGIINIGVGF